MQSFPRFYAENVAQLCHEVNRAYNKAIGDKEIPDWRKAPDWQKVSVLQGVLAVFRRDITSPEQAHEKWLSAKKADGWEWGEKKDPIAKTHPCFKPFSELPKEQQAKDHIFFAIANFLRPLESRDVDTVTRQERTNDET